MRRPVYENQKEFDLQILNKKDFCKKYKLTNEQYQKFLSGVEVSTGEPVPTPEKRERWAEVLEELNDLDPWIRDLALLTQEEYMEQYKIGIYTYSWKVVYARMLLGLEIK